MDDFTVNVRQISSYPFVAIPSANDAILLQRHGLGGPYSWTNPAGLLAGLSGPDGGLAVGFTLPYAARGLIASQLTSPQGSTQGFNWYRDQHGLQRFFRSGNAALWSFANGTLSLAVTPSGLQDQPIRNPIDWQQILQVSVGGQMELAGQLRLGRDPLGGQEVATLDWIRRSTVTSINGRSGAVTLEPRDLNVKSPANPALDNDTIATTAWVQNAISFRLTDLLSGYPFVTSFNGRKNDVVFRLDDWHQAAFRRGAKPKVPTPPAFDNSHRIANTRWVMDEIENIQLKEGPPGPVGPQGPMGTGFNFRGNVPDQPSLPMTGNEVGDLFITSDTNMGFVWDGTAWQEIGIITPSSRVFVSDTPPGAPTNGDLWWNSNIGELSVWFVGASASQWVVANTGFPGPQGAEGPIGPPGPAVHIGTTQPLTPQSGQLWYNPSTGETQVWNATASAWQPISAPGATVSVGATPPATPADGDLWWNANDGELMVWFVGPSGSQWVIANAGAVGAQGPPGLTGAPGAPGPPGMQGPPGTGLTFLGSVPTQTALPPGPNNNGDMYVTADTQEMFVWSDVTNSWDLVGVGGGIAEAPTGMPGNPVYGRQNAGWVELLDDGVF